VRVTCSIEEIDLEGDYSTIDSVCATCTRCEHVTESFGTSSSSVRRCLVLMREECPRGENNFYVAAEGEDEE
jgi:hypothetical protein